MQTTKKLNYSRMPEFTYCIMFDCLNLLIVSYLSVNTYSMLINVNLLTTTRASLA